MSLESLHDKVAAFTAKLSAPLSELSQCRSGCYKCCLVDLTVFQLEADHIRTWFAGLSEEKKLNLRKHWERDPVPEKTFSGAVVLPCSFLSDGICTIYEARPLICRTQGLGFSFTDGKKKFFDICPLNEPMLEKLTATEVLNLDLLNAILSQLEALDAAGADRPRITLSSLRTELT